MAQTVVMKKPREYVKIRRATLEKILRDAKRIEEMDKDGTPGMTSSEAYARALGACNGIAVNIRILSEYVLEAE